MIEAQPSVAEKNLAGINRLTHKFVLHISMTELSQTDQACTSEERKNLSAKYFFRQNDVETHEHFNSSASNQPVYST